jgi:hypothetical protein
MRSVILAVVLVCTAALPALPQLDGVLKGLGGKQPGAATANDGQVASGLKEALSVGTTKAVDLTGAQDGFWGNSAIKILMPSKMKLLEKGLRAAGKGPAIDEFELSMNRAAEKAAPAAAPIFKKAITGMSFSDARTILSGGGTAATDYFKKTTSADLTTAFKPIVEEAMSQTGVTQRYDALMKQAQGSSMMQGLGGLGMGKKETFNINDYVVAKSLDGLFFMLGKEEEKIRTDPSAQVTPLLKQVFGHRGN